MSNRSYLLMLLLIASPAPVIAQQPDSALVDRFLSVSGTDSILRADLDKLAHAPLPSAEEPIRVVLVAWQNKYFNWTLVRERIAASLESHATAAQVRDLIAFYESPLGRLSVSLTAELNTDYAAFILSQRAAHGDELSRAIAQHEDSLSRRAAPSP